MLGRHLSAVKRVLRISMASLNATNCASSFLDFDYECTLPTAFLPMTPPGQTSKILQRPDVAFDSKVLDRQVPSVRRWPTESRGSSLIFLQDVRVAL